MGTTLKIVIVTDKFKGSLTSIEAANSIASGIKIANLSGHFFTDIKFNIIPLADGGEGFLSVAARSGFFKRKEIDVVDPLGRCVKTNFLLSEEMPVDDSGRGRGPQGASPRHPFAVVEMSLSSGLSLLSDDEYDPLTATSYGFGQTIRAAIRAGAREIIAGIGGSATNDGGTGMLQALGYRFLDKEGRPLRCGDDEYMDGSALALIGSIDDSMVDPSVRKTRITVACDVTNPLLGQDGATYIYGPQKGADDIKLIQLEAGMKNFATVTERYLGFATSFLCDNQSFIGYDFSDFPGAGAAGGTGFALRSYLHGDLQPGWKVAADISNAEAAIAESHLVIAGEGRLDSQTLSGKLVDGMSRLAKRHNKPFWVYCGENLLKGEELKAARIDKVFTISSVAKNLNDSISRAKEYLEKISYQSATFLPQIQSNWQTH
jgi:glycerate kinase